MQNLSSKPSPGPSAHSPHVETGGQDNNAEQISQQNNGAAMIHKALVLVTGLALAPNAFAYLDPGTGSIIIQGLIAGIAMIGVTARMYWHKLQSMFGFGSAGKNESNYSVEQNTDQNAKGEEETSTLR